MRMQRFPLCLLVLLLLVNMRINPTAYNLARKKRHPYPRLYYAHGQPQKRMAVPPRNIYADFASIDDNEQLSSFAEAEAGKEGEKKCKGEGEKATCDVKQIFSTGDPKQKTMSIALKAAQDAKAANEAQVAAGAVAAQHIKQELAEKAYQSAKAAEAALSGKQMMVEQLEQEMREAEVVVQEETSSLQTSEMNMKAAMDVAHAATVQFESLTELQKTAQENLANINTVAQGSQQELADKSQLLEAAKNRVSSLQKQLQGARDDFEKTKDAAYKAACAAVEAKQKAASVKRQRSGQKAAFAHKKRANALWRSRDRAAMAALANKWNT